MKVKCIKNGISDGCSTVILYYSGWIGLNLSCREVEEVVGVVRRHKERVTSGNLKSENIKKAPESFPDKLSVKVKAAKKHKEGVAARNLKSK